jgi:catalase
MGRTIGILVADGSDAVIEKMKRVATYSGTVVKIVAPKVGGAILADGSLLADDGQLVGTPSVLFDAVAVYSDAVGRRRGNRLGARCLAISKLSP